MAKEFWPWTPIYTYYLLNPLKCPLLMDSMEILFLNQHVFNGAKLLDALLNKRHPETVNEFVHPTPFTFGP